MAKLTGAQFEAYRQDGYVLYHDQLFRPDEMERLTTIFEEQLAQKGEKLSDELDTPHFRDARLLQFLLDDKVLDLVEPITGGDTSSGRVNSSARSVCRPSHALHETLPLEGDHHTQHRHRWWR